MDAFCATAEMARAAARTSSSVAFAAQPRLGGAQFGPRALDGGEQRLPSRVAAARSFSESRATSRIELLAARARPRRPRGRRPRARARARARSALELLHDALEAHVLAREEALGALDDRRRIPKRRATASALELPGTPSASRKVGLIVARSKPTLRVLEARRRRARAP